MEQVMERERKERERKEREQVRGYFRHIFESERKGRANM